MWIRKQDETGNEIFEPTDESLNGTESRREWATNAVVAMGRSLAQPNRTYILLTRTDGTPVYLSVDTGTTLVVSTTKP